MESLIKELNELKAILKDDGYKDWCYAQLTIDKAIKVVKNCNILAVSNRRELLFAFIKEWKEEFKDENWDYLDFVAERVLSKQ